jgi:hypothetical protein
MSEKPQALCSASAEGAPAGARSGGAEVFPPM